MAKKIIVGLLGLMVIGAGVAVFSANTAQWVNVTARVEKEIEMACVLEDNGFLHVDPDGCDYGVTFPENIHEKVVEVTLSNSFYNQHVKSDVLFDVLWECKLIDETGVLTLPDGTPNICREDIENEELIYDPVEMKWVHRDPLKLDGNIRDHTIVTATSGCLVSDPLGPGSGFDDGGPAKLEYLGSGVVDRDVGPKCLYHLAFNPPACEGHVNYLTDPGRNPKEVPCHEVTEDKDPQRWDRFTNLGDTFKIQVFGFSYD